MKSPGWPQTFHERCMWHPATAITGLVTLYCCEWELVRRVAVYILITLRRRLKLAAVARGHRVLRRFTFYQLLANTGRSTPFHHHIMVLSVSGFPESSPGDSKLITRLFGANRTMDEPQPRHQTRHLPSSTSSPSSSPTPQPIRPTIPSTYKRPRTSSQGFGSGSLCF